MNDFGRSVPDTYSAKQIIGWSLLGVLVVALVGYLLVAFILGPGKEIQKAGMAVERQVNQTSQQYVSTQVRSMRDQIAKYDTNEIEILKLAKDESNADVVAAMQTQQKGIVRFVRTACKDIAADAIPADVRDFLDSH